MPVIKKIPAESSSFLKGMRGGLDLGKSAVEGVWEVWNEEKLWSRCNV